MGIRDLDRIDRFPMPKGCNLNPEAVDRALLTPLNSTITWIDVRKECLVHCQVTVFEVEQHWQYREVYFTFFGDLIVLGEIVYIKKMNYTIKKDQLRSPVPIPLTGAILIGTDTYETTRNKKDKRKRMKVYEGACYRELLEGEVGSEIWDELRAFVMNNSDSMEKLQSTVKYPKGMTVLSGHRKELDIPVYDEVSERLRKRFKRSGKFLKIPIKNYQKEFDEETWPKCEICNSLIKYEEELLRVPEMPDNETDEIKKTHHYHFECFKKKQKEKQELTKEQTEE